ncbi:hypothetical protein [Deinococcus cellulosilyticus]|uniref:Uncharacterized protein n=1 Tax=Deinococcus cellulosilyticus (strain DSM 18568 / NBRC 106333 / KACC 11606 / 5516J-15) TaxID=1223518 RepID=A0A511N840_DEIC1|nr:hypothetical protein [Deinococcus cellulosilyticus]GEM49005.1 hypothetical protein DC3_46400 [Deinococcus cellulosilyticus NBRC 106333 = KACC 11606]
MKLSLVVLLGLLVPHATAQSLRTQSIYTSLNARDCITLEQHTGPGEFIRQRCPGVGKYRLEVSEGDLRSNVQVQYPDGHLSTLDLISRVSSGFSSLGPKAEWRVQKNLPVALILRYNASENPEDGSLITSYLVVSKITSKSACVVGIIKPQANQNVLARKLADQALQKPCLEPEF